MNRTSGLLGIAVGRIAAARRRRHIELATRDLSDRDLSDIGFRRDWRGHLVPNPADY